MKTVALLVLAAGVLCSCSKKNDIPVTPNPPVTVKLDRIAKIQTFSREGGAEECIYEVKFNYDSQLRLASMVDRNPSNPLIAEIDGTFDYSGRMVKFVYNDHKATADLTQATEYNLSLDGGGKATKLETKLYYRDPGVVTLTQKDYEYDQEGHLKKYVFENVKISFKWQNKNMIEWTRTVTTEKDGVINTDITTEPWKYDKTPSNHTYPDLNRFLAGETVESMWVDYLGLRSARLASGYTAGLGTSYQRNKTFKYTLDAKGRPSEVKEWENGKLRQRHVITYLQN